MKFDKGRRSDYKTEKGFLRNVYKRNKVVIDKVFGPNAKEIFVNNVIAQKQIYGVNVTRALNIVARSRSFTPYKEVAYENVTAALKKFDQAQTFRDLIRDEKTGRFKKFDSSKMKWNRELNRYEYDNKVYIRFDESPMRVVVERITS